MNTLVKIVTRNPGTTLLVFVILCCLAFGPAMVGGWIGTHGRAAVLGVYRFTVALIQGVL